MASVLATTLIVFVWCLAAHSYMCITPPVFYANVGDTVVLQCNNAGSGPYGCFSTYTFQSMSHPMVMLNQSMKYQINMGSITINNVQPTDAGFYACSQNCWQMKSDLISYYLQPMTMGQPVDVTRFWRPIPPVPSYDLGGDVAQNQLVVYVSDERLYANKHSGLSDGEIAALVIGLFIALVIAIAIVTFLVIKLRRKRKQKPSGARETILEHGGNKNEAETTSVDYSTIDRNCDTRETTLNLKWKDQQNEKKPLTTNKSEPARSNPEINTRNIRGPQVVNPQELPSIDINSRNNASQRSQQQVQVRTYSITGSNTGSYNAGSGENRAYQNQYEGPYDPNKSGSGLISPPPPTKGPTNKIQFPTRTYQTTAQVQNQYASDQGSQRYVSNETMHLNQIIKDAGFIADNVDRPYESEEEFARRESSQNRTGYFNTRNPDSQYNYENNNLDSSYRHGGSNQEIDAKDTAAGGVTVISARAPGKAEQETIIPSATNRSYQPQATKFSFQNQQQQQPPNQKPYMSYSQRVDCATMQPLQLPPRNLSVNANVATSAAKDSATDV